MPDGILAATLQRINERNVDAAGPRQPHFARIACRRRRPQAEGNEPPDRPEQVRAKDWHDLRGQCLSYETARNDAQPGQSGAGTSPPWPVGWTLGLTRSSPRVDKQNNSCEWHGCAPTSHTPEPLASHHAR
jgi:hypothetical protein